jgi:tetrahydromethanopterin S-methyltransferase subunit G
MSDKTTEEIVEATKILEDVLPEPLRNFFDKLSDEERRRIFYCLDYILNYFQERRVPELEKLGFEKELDVLKKIGIVIEEKEHFRAKKIGKDRGMSLLGAFIGLTFTVLKNMGSYGNITPIMTFWRTVCSWPIHAIATGFSVYSYNKFQGMKKLFSCDWRFYYI